MLTAGIDVGTKTIKIVVIDDNIKLKDYIIIPSGKDSVKSIKQAWDNLKTERNKIELLICTGAGYKIANGDGFVTEVSAAAKGGKISYPESKIVVDIGAEEGRAIKVNNKGKIEDFAINEKCAAGAGAFIESMARALELSLEEMGTLSISSTENVAMNAQCAVFAESELVTLIHAKTPKNDMAKAIHNAIADRIISMMRRIGIQEKILLIGGVARNIGFVDCLNNLLETKVIIPKIPEILVAYGAALLGKEDNFSKIV